MFNQKIQNEEYDNRIWKEWIISQWKNHILCVHLSFLQKINQVTNKFLVYAESNIYQAVEESKFKRHFNISFFI